MARYPVTVGQWRAYQRASGVSVGAESLRGEPTHPVAHVSWRDAVGFCAWLTDALRGRARAEAARPAGRRTVPDPLATLLLRGDGQSGPWAVRLPSEAEWEKAARGDTASIYPWGREADLNRANYLADEAALMATSAVGCFPGGASPYAVEELAGNVWEWTRSGYRPYPYNPADGRERGDVRSTSPRVVRGGSCSNYSWLVRSECRDESFPDDRSSVTPDGRYDFCGFRVVVAPFSSDL